MRWVPRALSSMAAPPCPRNAPVCLASRPLNMEMMAEMGLTWPQNA